MANASKDVHAKPWVYGSFELGLPGYRTLREFMLTLLFRSVVRYCWSLTFLAALVGAAHCWAPTSTAAAPAAGTIHIYLPLIVSAQQSIASATTLEQRVVELTNALRQQHGCPALQISPELSVAARAHSQEMADHNYFNHVDLSGHRSDWRAQQAGYTGIAGWENIAAGYPTADAVVAGWYNETPPNDGHRRNILDCSLTEVGVGVATNPKSDYGIYWTQDFGQH
jgi:uncharacterized protein YkwD